MKTFDIFAYFNSVHFDPERILFFPKMLVTIIALD